MAHTLDAHELRASDAFRRVCTTGKRHQWVRLAVQHQRGGCDVVQFLRAGGVGHDGQRLPCRTHRVVVALEANQHPFMQFGLQHRERRAAYHLEQPGVVAHDVLQLRAFGPAEQRLQYFGPGLR